MSRYLVGIDLGTTHTVVAYCDTQNPQHAIEIFPIPQLVAAGEVANRPLLASTRYHPASGELAEAATTLSFPLTCTYPEIEPAPIFGSFAHTLGSKVQGRLVTSAKSWLSHSNVDRTAAILPWGSADEVTKISPLHASASYLAYVAAAWQAQFPDYPLAMQTVILTVPASFDEVARSLTVQAAQLAGLPQVRLLEEPQAACYDWLQRHQASLHQQLQHSRLLLVCDVGGGTTDLTLIKIVPTADTKQPTLTRIGVGDHLMLGGDNMDLALAHLAEQRFKGVGKALSSSALAQLIQQSRAVKEQLLQPKAPDTAKVTLLGSGRQLIGAAQSTEFSREAVQQLVLDGFFPNVTSDAYPQQRRSGLLEFGLPYVADPAVTRHIADFLAQHRQAAADALAETDTDATQPALPDTVLLNGGVFNSQQVTQRLLEVLSQWRGGQALIQLDNPHPDLAVARGAVAYALARQGKSLKIGGGAARSYFLRLETDTDSATSEDPRGICLLPRGTEEGQEVRLAEQTFLLNLGQPVQFHLAATPQDTAYQAGDVIALPDTFNFLPPIASVIGDAAAQQQVSVQLATTMTEVGTLAVECVAMDAQAERWRLEFQLRSGAAAMADNRLMDAGHPRFAEAVTLIQHYFTQKSGAPAIKSLRGELEKLLGPREQWAVPLLRQLFTALLEVAKRRRRSADHERAWLNLIGYCLRPGFGYPLDDWRVQQVWALYPQGIQYRDSAQVWAEWWTLWRRIAGGLEAHAQSQLYQAVANYLSPVPKKIQKHRLAELKKKGYEEIVRLVGSLEQLPVAQKVDAGQRLVQRLQKASESPNTFWALGRLGARVPWHGSVHQVVPADTATAWAQTLLAVDWKKQRLAGFAASLLVRMSGDRARDVEADIQQQVLQQLQAAKAPASWAAMVATVTVLEAADTQQLLGEALPPGLQLLES